MIRFNFQRAFCKRDFAKLCGRKKMFRPFKESGHFLGMGEGIKANGKKYNFGI